MIREVRQSEALNIPKKTKQQKGGNIDGSSMGVGIDASSKQVRPCPILVRVRVRVRPRDFVLIVISQILCHKCILLQRQ